MEHIDRADRFQAGNSGVMTAAGVPLACLCIGLYLIFTSWEASKPKATLFGAICCIMMAICAMYGCIYAIIVHSKLSEAADFIPGYLTLADGIIVGITTGGSILGLAFFGRSGIQAVKANDRNLVGCVLITIFIEAMALYGFIIGLAHMVTAQKKELDLSAGASMEFAFGDVAAVIGAVVGSAMTGIAIAQAGVEKGAIDLKWMLPIVFNGVTAIYGLIATIVAGSKIPEVGRTAYIDGMCYLLSSVGLTYFGYYGVWAIAGDSSKLLPIVVKLIGSQSFGLLGLCISLFASGGLPAEAHRDQHFCLAHGNYYDNGSCYSDAQQVFLVEAPAQHWAFAAVFLAVSLPAAAVLLGCTGKRENREPLLA